MLIDSLSPKYQKGDHLQKIYKIEEIIYQDNQFQIEKSEFCVEEGIVYLLIIWNKQSYKYKIRIDRQKFMLKKNPQWEEKVQLIFILNDNFNDFLERHLFKKQRSIRHFIFSDQWNKPLIKQLNIPKENPFDILINKEGQVIYLGTYFKGNMEARINELIGVQIIGCNSKGLNINIDTSKPQELMAKKKFKALKQQVKILQTALKEAKFEGIVEVVLKKVIYLKLDGSKEIQKKTRLALSYDIDGKEEPKLNQFLENYWNQIPENFIYTKKAKIRDLEKSFKYKKEVFRCFLNFRSKYYLNYTFRTMIFKWNIILKRIK